jgi:hypothetical protein
MPRCGPKERGDFAPAHDLFLSHRDKHEAMLLDMCSHESTRFFQSWSLEQAEVPALSADNVEAFVVTLDVT